MHIAAFVTSHGFGHAARASAVLAALLRLRPSARIDLFTTVPPWFFFQSLPRGAVRYHLALVDPGLLQKTPFREDIPATLRLYRDLYPVTLRRLDGWARRLRSFGCSAVLCDIAPLGILAAERTGLPSILVENFTWDWILGAAPGAAPARRLLHDAFSRATLRIRARPACGPVRGTARVPPIARTPKLSRRRVRDALAIPAGSPMILMTLAQGARWIERDRTCTFVLAGRSALPAPRHPRVRVLRPHAFYHPDLIHAADAVAGKIGYSTLAEACVAGTPFGFIPRDSFRESAVLERHLRGRRLGVRIEQERFERGDWSRELEELLACRRAPEPNGAAAAAGLLLEAAEGYRT